MRNDEHDRAQVSMLNGLLDRMEEAGDSDLSKYGRRLAERLKGDPDGIFLLLCILTEAGTALDEVVFLQRQVETQGVVL